MAQSQGSYARFDDEAFSGQATMSRTLEAQHALARKFATNGRDKHKVILYGLGIAECVLAGLMIILAITTLCLTPWAKPSYGYYEGDVSMTYTSQGLWGGVLVIVTGILGLRTKKNPSVSMYKANMTMSIVTASMLSVVVILSGIASAMTFAVPFHIVITILSFAAMVICIVHSAYCCARTCCESMQYQEVMVYVPEQNQLQAVRLANVQYAVPVGNTVIPQQYGYVMATSAQAPTPMNSQPSKAGVFAQQTVLPSQPATPNSPGTQDNLYTLDTANEVDRNPPSYSALL